MESCGMNVIKYVLFIFNLIFAISGIGIIAAGALVLADMGEFNHFVEGRILAPPIILIIAGSIVFIVAFLGCYGAIKEHYNMLIAFAAALLIIFIMELAAGIAAADYKRNFNMTMKDTLKESMKSYMDPNTKNPETITWDNVQQKLMCCGVDGPSDWNSLSAFIGSLPRSCIMIGVGIGIAFVEIVGIVLACCLAMAIKRESDK